MRAFPAATLSGLLRGVVCWLEQANSHSRKSFERLEATAARAASFDEDAYRAKIETELLAREDIDWAAVADLLGLGGCDLPPVGKSATPPP